MVDLNNLDPKVYGFLEAVKGQGGLPIYKLSVSEARQVLIEAQKGPIDKLPVKLEDKTISDGISGELALKIFRPENSVGKLPVIMFFHGGGWILGNEKTHERLVCEIVNGSEAAVVFVNYTPSPEAQYPMSIEQAYMATKYIAEHGEEMQLDAQRLAVVGDSVGGNMATVVTMLAKERKGPKIRCQVLFYPVTNADFNNGSYQEFADGFWLSKAAMEWFWDAYVPDQSARTHPFISPLHASIEQLKGLPPALIITDENDVLRDEGEAYAHKLLQAGVDVTAVRYLGTIHDFVMLNALANTNATKSAIKLANSYLKQALI